LGIIYRTLKNGWVFEDFPRFVIAPSGAQGGGVAPLPPEGKDQSKYPVADYCLIHNIEKILNYGMAWYGIRGKLKAGEAKVSRYQ
jgi:hypothetical protein